LFAAGKTVLALYLASAGLVTSYGAAGSLVVLLLWIYYSAQIFLFGAEFTEVYSRTRKRTGSAV
jgi:membrane protein